MHATPDRYLDEQFITNGSGLLQAEPPRVSSQPAIHPPAHGPQTPPRLGRIFVITLLILGAGVVAGLLPRLHQKRATREESQALGLSSVRVVLPAPAHLAVPVALSGELRPVVEAPIYARASGYVREWHVDLGAHVEAGQSLAELDTPELDRELATARAEQNQAAAAVALSQATAKRWTQMLSTKAVSAQETDEKSGDFSVKTAALAASQSNVERLEKLTGFSKLTAPFAGTITARKLDIGQLVNAGNGQELFRLAETDKLRVFVRVPQSFARSIAVGQKAEITLPELQGRTFDATVVRTAGAIDAASRTLLTELEVDNSKGELLAGSYVQVRLPETQSSAALAVASNTLIFRSEGPQIATVTRENRIQLRKVTLGRDFGPTIEILDGVQAQDRLVLNPSDSLVDGIEVRVAQDEPKKP